MTPEQIADANKLAEKRDLAGAWRIVDSCLEADPNDIHALIVASFLCEREGKYGIGYNIALRACDVAPNSAAAWTNYGRMCDLLWRGEEAKTALRKSLARSDTDKGKCLTLVNLSAVLVQECKWEEAAEVAQKALELEPENFKARHNLGMCQLAMGNYAEGWDNYAYSVGNTANRPRWHYGTDKPWKGETDGIVVIYGEQGIGDEISAASMFPDAIRTAQRVVIECDARLESLYKRSFPGAAVYGTRNKLEVSWNAQDAEPDYSIASFQLGGLFRREVEDFPGTPYLVADPERVRMWRGLWAEEKRPVIGIAWTGGTKHTAKHARRWTLEQMLPLLQRNAKFVCLQYTDAKDEIEAFSREHRIDIGYYPFATLSKDFDDTASLVASLDSVVTMQQTAGHLAGALGIRCHIGLPALTQWRYGVKGRTLPWYASATLYRQKHGETWDRVINEIADAAC